MTPGFDLTIDDLVALALADRKVVIRQQLTVNQITKDHIQWAFKNGRHDCAQVRWLAAYMLKESNIELESAMLDWAQLWLMTEDGQPIRAMLAVALYKRGHRTGTVMAALSKATDDKYVGQEALNYLQAA